VQQARIAQVIRQRETEEVQGMALDVLAAEKQLAQQVGLRRDLDAHGRFRGLQRGERVSDGTYGADA
jgi:hypothetical protein